MSSTRLGAAGLGLLVWGACGCGMEPGAWFLELEPAVTAQYREAANRVVEPGWQKLASEYHVRLTRADLQIEEIELYAGSAPAASFNPARPPAGFSLCHNGHCHAADGRLVPYDEVASSAAGGAPVLPVVVLGGGTWNLLSPALPAHPDCQPSCQLGRTHLVRARINLQRLLLEGEIRGPGANPTRATFSFSLPSSTTTPLPPLTAPLDLRADNQHHPHATLSIDLQPGASLLDGVPWGSLPVLAGAFDLTMTPTTEAALADVKERLAETAVAVLVQRQGQ